MIWTYLIIGLSLLVLGVLAYWQLVIAEGTYLGPRIVTLLYDWAAPAYERIKRFSNAPIPKQDNKPCCELSIAALRG